MGVILYRMATGNQPFYEGTEWLVYQRVSRGEYKIPKHVDPTLADLIKKLLQIEPEARLGSNLDPNHE